MRTEFRRESLQSWESTLLDIFPEGVPTSCAWHDLAAITSVLNAVGARKYANHTFLPRGGGLDLTGACASEEQDCIEIHFGESVHIVKPHQLILESFGYDYEWAYFRLETRHLEPTGIYRYENDFPFEPVTEIDSGVYRHSSIWEENLYDYGAGMGPLRANARLVHRYFRGSFVTFCKGSLYNMNGRTYDARHDTMTGPAFRRYIEEVKDVWGLVDNGTLCKVTNAS